MNNLQINRFGLSALIWHSILQRSVSLTTPEIKSLLLNESLYLEKFRVQATLNTGSINFVTFWLIYSVVLYFSPHSVAEVGTFIGRSTLAISRALENTQSGSEIHTCDFSNNIPLPFSTIINVTQYPLQSSSMMFDNLIRTEIFPELFVIDGRLPKNDFVNYRKLFSDNCIVVLDDFEGIEKGVVNALSFMEFMSQTHTLIYPPPY